MGPCESVCRVGGWNLEKFSCLMVEVRLKPTPILLGFSFDLQEHKSHNNAALVMDHLSLL